MSPVGAQRCRNDDRKRGANTKLHAHRLRHIENAEGLVQNGDNDRATADAEQTRQDAGDEAAEHHRRGEPSEFVEGNPKHHSSAYTAIRRAIGILFLLERRDISFAAELGAALAQEFYIVQEPSTKRCTTVSEKPTGGSMVVMGGNGKVYAGRSAAETAVKEICTTGSTSGGSTTTTTSTVPR